MEIISLVCGRRVGKKKLLSLLSEIAIKSQQTVADRYERIFTNPIRFGRTTQRNLVGFIGNVWKFYAWVLFKQTPEKGVCMMTGTSYRLENRIFP